jgi:hypothetical protein
MNQLKVVEEPGSNGTATAFIGAGECQHRISGKCAGCVFMHRTRESIADIQHREERIDRALAAR